MSKEIDATMELSNIKKKTICRLEKIGQTAFVYLQLMKSFLLVVLDLNSQQRTFSFLSDIRRYETAQKVNVLVAFFYELITQMGRKKENNFSQVWQLRYEGENDGDDEKKKI